MSDQVAEKRFNVYYSAIPSMQVIDEKGNPIVFVSSRFHTMDPSKIAFLDKMIADGTTAVFVNPNQLTMSEADLDPMETLRRKHIQEYLAQQAEQINPESGATESKQGPLNAASTTDIAAVTLGAGTSASTDVKAKLAALHAQANK